MKSVLTSVHPKWCELIANGEKTMEVRRTRPKTETPFKCYIYETKARSDMPTFIDEDGHVLYTGRGQVIGEFVCDCITPLYNVCTDEWRLLRGGLHEIEKQRVGMACLTEEELHEYANGKYCYAWHISDLKIYDDPKELSEFWRAGKCPYASENGCTYESHCFRSGQTERCGEALNRPPQSWCYVEDPNGLRADDG